MLKLLWKIFVIRFYVLNAGFFLFSFILIFGVVYPPQLIVVHTSLIYGIIQSNLFTAVVLFLWLLYNLKCIFFSVRIITREENTILYNMQAISPARQWILLLICHVTLYLPIIIYSFFIIYLSRRQGYLLYSNGLIFFQLLMCALGVYTYYFYINFAWKEVAIFRIGLPVIKQFGFKIQLPYYLVYYTLCSRKIIFFILKLTGLFLLNSVLAGDNDQFNMREFILVFMIDILIHSLLVYYYVEFMEKMISFTRNLPITRLFRFSLFLLTYSLLLLPDLCFIIIKGFQLIPIYIILVFYGIAIAELLLFTSTLYISSMKMKRYLQLIFSIYLVISLLTLSGYYTCILLATLTLTLYLFNKQYYKYEVFM
ncbi:MAG: hypothetical protein ABIN89_01225 [Chitinophagaceae bacterium]